MRGKKSHENAVANTANCREIGISVPNNQRQRRKSYGAHGWRERCAPNGTLPAAEILAFYCSMARRVRGKKSHENAVANTASCRESFVKPKGDVVCQTIERLVIQCRTTSASTASCASRKMCSKRVRGKKSHDKAVANTASCRERIFIEVMTSDQKLEVSREGSK